MKNILMIPHQPSLDVKVRSLEIARILARSYNVYYLVWERNTSHSLWPCVKCQLSSLFSNPQLSTNGNICFISGLSKLYRPFGLAWFYNSIQLRRFIKAYNIDVVINAEAGVYAVPRFNGMYIYDLVDDAFSFPNTHGDIRRAFVARELSKANYVTTISHRLCDVIKNQFNHKAVLVPNGTDIKLFKDSDIERNNELKSQLGIGRGKVIGFVGNFEKWTGLEFLIDVFLSLCRKRNDIWLLIVGGGSESARLSSIYGRQDRIIFIGVVNPSVVHEYFRIIDVGVIPFELSDFTNNAFPIKAVEYSCAGSIVVSSMLDELVFLKFPNMIFADRNIEQWELALSRALEMKWDSGWDSVLEQYDWNIITGRITGLISGAN